MAEIVDDVVKNVPLLNSVSPTVAAIIVTIVPGIFYTLAAYAHLYLPQLTLAIAIVISVIFATFEYVIRVPIIEYSANVAGMSNTQLQFIWVGITLGLAYLTDEIWPRDSIKKSKSM